MTSSVTKWLSNLSSKPPTESKGLSKTHGVVSSLVMRKTGNAAARRRPLSAQSTLESLREGEAAAAAAAAAAAGSPPVTSTGFPSTECSENYCSDLVGASPAMHSKGSISESNASLTALFTAVSPYVSSADIRHSSGFRRLYDSRGPVVFSNPPLHDIKVPRGEMRLWEVESERIISQNSSNRRVHRVTWTSNLEPQSPRPAALKFVEDNNSRDGRSLKREIECHIYTYQKLTTLYQMELDLRHLHSAHYSYTRMPEWAVVDKLEDSWPCAELFGYYLDRRSPGKSVLLTRKLSGPDLFDVIRAEHNHNWHFHHTADSSRCRSVYSHRANSQAGSLGGSNTLGCVYYSQNYEYHKLRWCALALHRLSQYALLSIRHNDVKPDNIVLDFHYNRAGHKALDVKLIDLGTASMCNAKDFTGGTSWYESPEQKLLEYFMKKKKNPEAAKRVEINLSSDVWGAGISLTEVLVGRRVVDSLKSPTGPGSLDYLGFEASSARRTSFLGSGVLDYLDGGGDVGCYPYWAMDPAEWLQYARRALGLDREHKNTPLTHEAARWLFDNLVRPEPSTRASLQTALEKLERYAEEAYQRYRYSATSFQHRIDAYELPKN